MGKTTTFPSDTWIILPAFNEAVYLGTVLSQVRKITNNFIVVDDGSSDDTSSIASEFTDNVLTHQVNLGKGAALLTGCEFALQNKAKVVVFMDSDNQHQVDELPILVSKVSKKNAVVLGSRNLNDGMPLLRKIGNASLSVWIYVLYGVWVSDVLSGYRAIHTSVLPSMYWNSTRYGVEAEMVARMLKKNIPFTTAPITTIYHDYKRGMTLLDAVELYWQLLMWRILL